MLLSRKVLGRSSQWRTSATRALSSSFSEPCPTLFNGSALETHQAPDAQLRSDVRTMGSLLGKIIRERNGQEIFDKVEKVRILAKDWRNAGAGRGTAEDQAQAKKIFQEMTAYVKSMSNEDLFWVSRAFTHFLAVANSAEGHHRGRVLFSNQPISHDDIYALPNKPDSCGGLLPDLVNVFDKEHIWDTLTSQCVELVLTAHPTEVNRRTILEKQRRVQKILKIADNFREGTTPYRKQLLNDSLEREISSIWQSDEVAREKPTPQDEAERGTLVVETVLWEAVPKYLKKMDATMKAHLGSEFGLPLRAAPLKFASWMGGDRDGNPNVTPDVTREVTLMKRLKAANLFRRDLMKLQGELSISHCDNELSERLEEGVREPYRAFIEPMIQKLGETAKWAQQELDYLREGIGGISPKDSISSLNIYLDKAEFTEDLLLIHKSLCSTGNEVTADGTLSDIIRNVSVFGLTLVPLDIRQESDRHTEALDSITKFLGLGSYEQWDEETKISWLTQQLGSKRPLLRPYVWNEYPETFSPNTVDTLETFQMIAEQHEGSLGAYVISQATTASDVLAVLTLQRDAGVKQPLRVVPLFETLDDLRGAHVTMESLYNLPAYMGSISGKQEIMIGYSDSAKDAGRLAASWAQYETQEQLAELAKQYGIEVTFFHGKGGTVGRGGNPATFKAILAHAPETINGRFRVTEQGEMINQNFGHGDRAERTMDIYTSAVLAEKLTERAKPAEEQRAIMHKLSDISCEAYRRIVRDDPRFVPYFRSATPELELSNLNIGSRPAKRKATGGVESLRAIPWNFSWTQTRLNLPTWLGVGQAVNDVLSSEDGDKLRTLYQNWGPFATTIDLVEMVLAKSEPSIARHYDEVLVSDPKAIDLGQEIQSLHAETEKAVLDLTKHQSLSETNSILLTAMQVRNPYVDCLNVLQTETLLRMRKAEQEGSDDKILKDALLTTITGIANGMGNTG